MIFKSNIIRVKAMCLLSDGERVLVGKGQDFVKKNYFYRVLGGSTEFGETSEEGVRREIREELGCDIENLELLDVIENIFEFEGQKGHEITFMFKGRVSDKSIEKKDAIHIQESDYEYTAYWISINDVLEGKVILYPTADYKKYLK